MMTLRQLQYLLAVNRTKNFVRAAELCHVTQPTLSMQLQQLESRLGTKLVERGSKQVMLTRAGEQVVEKADSMMCLVEEIEELCRQGEKLLEGEITLGVIPTVAPYFLPKILPELHKRFPKLKVYLKEDQTHNLHAMLDNGDIDVALLAIPADDRFVEKTVYEEAFVLALPKGHKLSAQKSVTIQDVQTLDLMLLEEGHCLRDQALEVCQISQDKAVGGADFRATSLETLKHMVSHSLGVTLLPELAVDEASTYEVLQFKDPQPIRKIGLSWRRTSVRRAEMDLLSQEISQILKHQ